MIVRSVLIDAFIRSFRRETCWNKSRDRSTREASFFFSNSFEISKMLHKPHVVASFHDFTKFVYFGLTRLQST